MRGGVGVGVGMKWGGGGLERWRKVCEFVGLLVSARVSIQCLSR